MAVHIGELHTDIRPAADDGQGAAAGSGQDSGDTADDRWRESRGRRTWIEARTSAYGYED